MKSLLEPIAAIGLLVIGVSLAAQDAPGSGDLQSASSAETRTIAALPLELLTDHPEGAAVAAAAHERVLSALASIEGVRVLGPDTTLPFADSELTRDGIADVLEELGAAAILRASVRAQYPMFNLQLTLHRSDGSDGFGAPIGYSNPDEQVTIYASDGEPMPVDPDAWLETAISELVDRAREIFFPESIEPPEQVAAIPREIFLDTSLSLRERMDALRELTPARTGMDGRYAADGPESLAGDIVAAAVDLAMTTDNAFVRAALWRQLAGVGDPGLVAPLLQVLASDPDEDVRLAAAMTLKRDFLDDPGVRDALDYAMTSDPSEKVRTEIDFSMQDADGQSEALRATVLNKSLTNLERTRAFSRLLGDPDATNDVDPELTAAMIEVARYTRTPHERTYALSALSRVDDPTVVELFLVALARDSDEGVRETAVRGLRLHVDDPVVREALEHAMVNDTSPLIRTVVEGTLRDERERSPAASAETIMSPVATEREKVMAWGMLRGNAADYWTDSIVAEMVRIGLTSSDPQVRADVWRTAHAAHTHPLLLQPLLQTLSSDPDENVRAEAAETLDLYLDEPGVRAALESAAASDPDADVRQQAQTSLAGSQSGF
ncbi:MAG: HEAT repeat domain-containing protein [Gammaproteobacteria bacterium]|nr:HEAT repeat domain-containing protein [Gammaproteobacteria bacterium]